MHEQTNKKKKKKKKFEAQEWPSSRHAKVSWVIFAEVPFYGAQPSVATSLGTLSCRAYDRFHWLSTLRLRLACRFNGVAPWKKKSWCSPSIFRSILDLIARYHASTVFNFSNYRANPFSDWRSGKIWKDSLAVFPANERNAFSKAF